MLALYTTLSFGALALGVTATPVRRADGGLLANISSPAQFDEIFGFNATFDDVGGVVTSELPTVCIEGCKIPFADLLYVASLFARGPADGRVKSV